MSDIVDYTRASEFMFGNLLAPGCRIVLTAEQFEVLKAYLGHIESLGDGINFQLDRCVDYSSSDDSAGCAVTWDHGGDAYQDDLVDTLMEDMSQNLGFDAGSILRPGYLIPLVDIDQPVADIVERVRGRQ